MFVSHYSLQGFWQQSNVAVDVWWYQNQMPVSLIKTPMDMKKPCCFHPSLGFKNIYFQKWLINCCAFVGEALCTCNVNQQPWVNKWMWYNPSQNNNVFKNVYWFLYRLVPQSSSSFWNCLLLPDNLGSPVGKTLL